MKGLDDFVREWRPTALAHNDFYDDQLILTPERELALVDYEEVAPGIRCWTSGASWHI